MIRAALITLALLIAGGCGGTAGVSAGGNTASGSIGSACGEAPDWFIQGLRDAIVEARRDGDSYDEVIDQLTDSIMESAADYPPEVVAHAGFCVFAIANSVYPPDER